MIKIEVRPDSVRSGVSSKGKPYAVQALYAYPVDREGRSEPVPEKIERFITERNPALPEGAYLLGPSSIRVKDRRLVLSDWPDFVPVGGKAPAPSK